jgi:hypothetical protein
MRFSLVQLRVFAQKWKSARLTDEDLQALEQVLIERPDAGDPMRGTGGLRKIRFAPPSRFQGKSGALRVCYASYPAYGLIFLVTLFAKNEAGNLTPAERKVVKALLERITASLREETSR